MSVYNDEEFERFLASMKDAPVNRKISAFRMEMQRHTPVITGYAEIIKLKIQNGEAAAHEKEFVEWLTRIIEAAKDIQKLMRILE